MIRAVESSKNSNLIGFSGEQEKAQVQVKPKYDHDTVLKNNPQTQARIAFDKFTNAITDYTGKGLSGNKKFNFYDFLTMGSIPYVIGSLTFIGVFNSAAKHFDAFSRSKALKYGNKMALGVIFYAAAKSLSKMLISSPVKMATGVDVNLPYARFKYGVPQYNGDTDLTDIEYHKVYESVEFPYWEMVYGDESKGEKRNAYFDKVAKKMGLGENLKDSDQEVKPRIKEVVTKSIAARNTIPYLWAALGVGLAVQKPWEDFLSNTSMKFYRVSEFKDNGKTFVQKLLGTGKNMATEGWKIVKNFGKTFNNSVKSLYNGGEKATKVSKIAGKAALFLPLLATIISDINIIHGAKKKDHSVGKSLINKDRKYEVS